MSQTQTSNPSHSVILFFDGYCSLCNWSVDFVMQRDKKRLISFASLQSETAKKLLPEALVAKAEPDSLVVWTPAFLLDESDAVLFIAKLLDFPYNMALVMKIMPRSWRDHLYRFVARNRYKWFGKRDTCRMPTGDELERMLD